MVYQFWGTWFSENHWWWVNGWTGWSCGPPPTFAILWFYEFVKKAPMGYRRYTKAIAIALKLQGGLQCKRKPVCCRLTQTFLSICWISEGFHLTCAYLKTHASFPLNISGQYNFQEMLQNCHWRKKKQQKTTTHVLNWYLLQWNLRLRLPGIPLWNEKVSCSRKESEISSNKDVN